MVTDSPLSQLDPQHPNYAIDVVDRLIPAAIQRGASDVHIQPTPNGWEVLFRIDGVLSVGQQLRGGGSSDPVTRLMVLAGLPTYRSSQPMEGRLRWSVADEPSDKSMRLGIFPSIHGPRAVVRLLRTDHSHDSIDSLGLGEEVSANLRQLCNCTDGAVLLSGPTGSGKTTTLYAMLRAISGSTPRRSVLTIEDPVESVIPAISQSELDPAAGMTLASALRSAVRQDSEVLLVSEIRDPETAEAAMQASLTGHLIFSSLHATDIPSSLRRLVQLGVPPYVVRSGLRAMVALRLLRRLCPHCSSGESQTVSPCVECLGTGYRGRFAIAQCVRFDGQDPVGEAIADALEASATVASIQKACQDAGGTDLKQIASRAVEQGITDSAEVYRVLGNTA